MIKIVFNKLTSTVTVNVAGDIGKGFFSDGVTLDSVMSKIQEGSPENIVLNVSSLGGDLFEALAIHDYIKALGKKTTANIIGNTASSGTVIAMAADQILISENSRFLIHQASAGMDGNADDFSAQADQLASFDNTIAEIYSKKTGQSTEFIKNLMKENRWMPANEAVKLGFCNGILKQISNIKKISNMTEEEIAALKAENEALKAQVAELQSKLGEMEDNAQKSEAEAVENIINEAIEAGKITDVEKDIYTNFGKGNVKGLKEKIKLLQPKNRVFAPTANATAGNPEMMTWDYLHKKDPKRLAEIKSTDKKLFNQIYRNEFHTDYKF